MTPSLAALVAVQALDSAADAGRRRLAELPAAEQALAAHITEAAAAVETARARLHENTTARRQLEKDVAAVDVRLARFDDHKAAVKTNQEYTALLHEIATAKQEKDGIEERLLLEMENADAIGRDVKAAEAALAKARRDTDAARTSLAAEQDALGRELARLTADRERETRALDARTLALYEQLRKGRRGVAVASMAGSVCTACHVRLRPSVEQQIRRNDSIVQCDSCQRILYAAPVAAPAETASDSKATGA